MAALRHCRAAYPSHLRQAGSQPTGGEVIGPAPARGRPGKRKLRLQEMLDTRWSRFYNYNYRQTTSVEITGGNRRRLLKRPPGPYQRGWRWRSAMSCMGRHSVGQPLRHSQAAACLFSRTRELPGCPRAPKNDPGEWSEGREGEGVGNPPPKAALCVRLCRPTIGPTCRRNGNLASGRTFREE
jgi:hypothetical protein